jgi:hypothetical protein
VYILVMLLALFKLDSEKVLPVLIAQSISVVASISFL